MKKLLTLDIGTTSVKISIFDQNLNLISCSNEEYQLITQGVSIVELEAEKYWQAVKNGIYNAIEQGGVERSEIAAVTATTQGETLIPVDHMGNALRNAIVWLDGRASKESNYISGKFDSKSFYAVTGIGECTGFCPVSKIMWIKNNEPEIYKQTYKFMLLEDYIIMKLTGRFVTEKSLICSTGYFDIIRDCLWDEILDYIGVSPDKIPDILECGTVVAALSSLAVDELGFSINTVVATGAMDQTAGAVGAGNLVPGMVTETTGTALCIGATTDCPDLNHPARVVIYRHIYPGKYLIIPISMTAGIVLKWFKDEFCYKEILESQNQDRSVYELFDKIVQEAPPMSNGLILVPYFTGVIQPDNNPYAKGIFFGVGLDTKKQHFLRSIFEAIAFMLRENIELIESVSGESISEVRSLGGGSKSWIWRKIKADISGKKIACMEIPECTSLGAAILGGVAVGMFSDAKHAAQLANRVKDYVQPDESLKDLYNKGYQKYREIYNRLKSLFNTTI